MNKSKNIFRVWAPFAVVICAFSGLAYITVQQSERQGANDPQIQMAEDAALRQNRLRLLGKLDQLFSGIAQFAEIVPAPANVGASTSGDGRAGAP